MCVCVIPKYQSSDRMLAMLSVSCQMKQTIIVTTLVHLFAFACLAGWSYSLFMCVLGWLTNSLCVCLVGMCVFGCLTNSLCVCLAG